MEAHPGGFLFLGGKELQFSKHPITFDQQIDLLISRGMQIPDKDSARHYLSSLNYYRLGAYWLPFETNHATHTFKDGTSFDDVIDLYVFDRELRLLVLDAIERIEVSIRTTWAYYLAHTHGAHSFLDESIFRDSEKYSRCLEALEKEVRLSTEVFIKHYLNKYTNPPLPPVWSIVEVMSLGQLSKWYFNLKHRRDRQSIATIYDLDERVLTSFLHHLTIVRNLCAHHSRLWNRKIRFQLKIPRRPNNLMSCMNQEQPKKLYNTLVMS